MQETARHNLAMETKGGEQSFKIVPTRVDVEGNTYELPVLFDPKSGDRYDPDTKAKIGDMAKYASGQSGWEAQAEKPQDTSTSFNADALSENLKELAPNFISAGRKYNVSPTLLASIAEHETGGGTSNAFLNKNNVMGVSDQKGPISFGNRAESIDRMARLIGEGINENKGPYAGAKTIQDLGSIYAPVGAENDQRGLNSGWTSGVSAGIDRLSQPSQQVLSQPPVTADLISQAADQAGVRQGAVRIQPPKALIETPEQKVQTQRLLDLDKNQSLIRDAGLTARQDIEPLKELKSLLDKDVTTGSLAESKYQIRKLFGSDVASTEEFKARAGEFAMKNIALTKGAISDSEMKYFKEELSPNVSKSNEGNKRVIEFKLKYAERAARISDKIDEMQSAGATPFEVQQEVKRIIGSDPLRVESPPPTDTKLSPKAQEYKAKFGIQ